MRRILVVSLLSGVYAVALLQALHWRGVIEYGGQSAICRVLTSERTVALTFDDGPDRRFTPRVLRLLQANDAKATFFVLGRHAEAHPDLLADIHRSGMEIGIHTWSHPHLAQLTAVDALDQVRRSAELLSADGSTLFRAPYGEVTAEQLRTLEHAGFTAIHWSIAPDAYVEHMSAERAAAELAEEVRPGDIILAHDAEVLPQDGEGHRTAAFHALRLLLPMLRDHGYTFTTVGSLLDQGMGVGAKPRWWFWEDGFACPEDDFSAPLVPPPE